MAKFVKKYALRKEQQTKPPKSVLQQKEIYQFGIVPNFAFSKDFSKKPPASFASLLDGSMEALKPVAKDLLITDYNKKKWLHLADIIEDQILRDKDPDEDIISKKSSLDFFIISRSGRLFTFWALLIAIASILSFLIGLYFAGTQQNRTRRELLAVFEDGTPRLYESLEIIFLVDCLLGFITEYEDEGGKTLTEATKIVRDPLKIIQKLLRSQSLYLDLFALLPFTYFLEPRLSGKYETDNNYDYFYLIYLLKLTRIRKASEYLSTSFINRQIQVIFNA